MERYVWLNRVAALALTALVAVATFAAPPGKVAVSAPDFDRDVRPILSERCFACHGPDPAARQANLRLDRPNRAVVAGQPTGSALLLRVIRPHGDPLLMPPVSSKKLPVTAAQAEILRRWIASGAVYTPHWAFRPVPARIAIPLVKQQSWVRDPIDAFVLARAENANIAPAADAPRLLWLRRVTLDLTGLTPSIADADAFAADNSPGAYETVVDRLLASRGFGERMATPWLDLARYADSYGYQSDLLSPTWPYRDWVIDAFNRNLPYDRFVTEQLAGDLLPNATREQRLATAFSRLHRMTNEGGSVADEWRAEGVADRVRTIGTAFLGLTIECARCHDHKYDPVTQREYYGLAAFVNSIDEYGLYDRADIVPTPTLLLPTVAQADALAKAKAEAVAAETAVRALAKNRESAFEGWLANVSARDTAAIVETDLTGRFDFERIDGAALPNSAPGGKENAERSDELVLVAGRHGNAGRFDGENNVHVNNLGRFTRHTPLTLALAIRDRVGSAEPSVLLQATDGTDTGPHGFDVTLTDGRLLARLYRHWPGDAIAIESVGRPVLRGVWTHIALAYDGSSRAGGLALYVDGRRVATRIVRDHLEKGIGTHVLALGQRFRSRGFLGGEIDDFTIHTRVLSPLEVAQFADGHSLSDALAAGSKNRDALRLTYQSAIDPDMRAASTALATARQRVWAAEDPMLQTMVMDETRAPRPTFVLARGRYDAAVSDADRVGRTTPAALGAFPTGAPRNRLGLACWISSPQNPLTARVEVNRLWAQCFGAGLVETPEDFGIQGKRPTNPALLDYLAREFVLSGWDIKRMLRRIVLSSAYRQSAGPLAPLPQRLSAEMVRDVALSGSGLLAPAVGGPPVSPYSPGDLWREANGFSPAYKQSHGPDLYRRALYGVWKRTAPLPGAVAFDASGREVCVARRQSTSTPLQALVLLNDPTFVEAARILGEAAIRDGGASDQSRIEFAFRRLATRLPSAREKAALLTLLNVQRRAFAADPKAAAALIAIGETKPDPKLDPTEIAAMTMIAQAILNSDAVQTRR